MEEIIVKNLNDNVGPGDIVGAFTNEANIKGNQIGNIDFLANNAIVEIDGAVAEKVIDIMDNNQVSGQKVRVVKEDNFKHKFKQMNNYLKRYKSLLQLERKEEMKRHELEIKNLSGREREKCGRAILDLRGRDQGKALGGKFLIKFMRQQQGEKLPDGAISVGDLVMLSQGEPLSNDNPTGTVSEITNYSMTVVFDNKPAAFLYTKGLRLDLYVNDITFQRMLTALDNLSDASGRLAELRDISLGFKELNFAEESELEFYNSELNKSQKKAVNNAIAAKDFFLVHGPPGTGKTMTVVEIIEQGIKAQASILATADSNTAVDNMLERLIERGVSVVRLGHVVRVNSTLREHTLDYLMEKNETYQQANDLREKAYNLIDQQDDYTHPSGRWRRGMSNEQIRDLAKKTSSSRGVPAEKIEEMAKWLKLQDEIDELFKEVDQLEEAAVNEILSNSDVVCATNSVAGSKLLENKNFELLVIDEATQASEPSALIPFSKAKKVVMAGDHKQLPPTILSEEAEKKGLAKSFFERLLEVHGKKIKQILTVQYRMNQEIMNFSNQEFYEGKLIADVTVADWGLRDLELDFLKGSTPAEKTLKCEEAICFLDLKGMRSFEYSKQDSKSIANQIEAELATEIAEVAINAGLNCKDLALISPYKDQVEFIKNLLKSDELEVDTVDGFQGREKELVILSLVRSNEYGNIGFLRDLRRLNVSLTRAKKKLIILGDSSTIASHPVYNKLIEYINKVGYYYAL